MPTRPGPTGAPAPCWLASRRRSVRCSTLVPADAGAAPSRHKAEDQEARQLLESIASVHGFYEKLALEELGQRTTMPAKPPALTAAEKEAARQNAGLARALYAIRIGLRPEGVREWNYSTNLHTKGGMSDRELLAAADLACQNEVWDRCINTSERTKSFIDLEQRFPMPFREAVVKRSREINLDPAYVYGLIRQESRFIMDARSHVGASGLMQVMPATAKWTAKKIGLVNLHARPDHRPRHQHRHRHRLPQAGAGRLRRLHAAGRCRLQRWTGTPPQLAQRSHDGSRDLGRKRALCRNP